MNGTHKGFRVDEGAYDDYAKQIDPLGDDFDSTARSAIAPHVELAGDGFSVMGGESGFSGAYGNRMRELEQRMAQVGGKWREMAEAARRTGDNYRAVEDDRAGTIGDIGKRLG